MIGIVLLVMVLQGGDVYKRLTIDDGLSQNMVNDILLDDRGFLWFATKDGLNRYDGHSFIVYRNYPGQLETLTSNHITSLVQTPDGTIWMTTYGGGINRIDPITGSGDPVPGSMQADVTFASAIRADSEQTLWVLSQSDGLIRLDPTTMTYDVLKEQPAFRNVGDISLFELTDQDRIWAVSSQMIQYIDPKTSRLLQWPVVDPADRPTSLLVLNDSLIVFSTRTGLQRMRVSGDRLVREVTSIRNQRFGFGNAFIKDRQGRIWFASLHDLYRYDPTEDRLIWLFHHGTRPTSSMLVDHSGILWIGTAGWGVMKYNPSRQYLRRGVGPYPPHVIPELIGAMRRNGQPIPDWLSGTDHAFHRTASGDEWISISGFRVYRYRPGSAELRAYRAASGYIRHNLNRGFNLVHVGRDQRVWLAGNGGLYELDPHNDVLTHHPIYEGSMPDREYSNRTGQPDITAITEDASGILWLGTPDRGVAAYDPHTRAITWVRREPGKPATISSNQILSVLVDPLNPSAVVWIGTEGGGLNRFDRSTGEVKTFYITDGLPSMVIYGLLADHQNHVWMSTNNGLARLDPASLEIRRFGVADGVHSREFNRYEYFRHNDGSLFFGGIGGYTLVIPSAYQPNRNEPRIRLTDVLLFNKRVVVDTEAPIRLRHDQDMITFEFAALEFTAPGGNRYRYRLDGFDRDWIESGTIRKATYTNLSPGEYTFRVQAANNDAGWHGSELIVPVIIDPPFWMTLWFRSLLIALGAWVLWMTIRAREQTLLREKARQEEVTLRVIEKQEEERRRIAHEMHDGLGQELLVLKNMINRWSMRPESAEPSTILKAASDQIGGILKSVREITHNLRPPELDRIGITETIRYTLEKGTSAAGLKLEADIQPFNRRIPADLEINLLRIVQEMLSNTIKHAGATSVTCRITAKETELMLHYHDDGVGLMSDIETITLRNGLGMLGLAERVRILGGALTLNGRGGPGLSYELRIPLHQTT